MKLLKDLLGKIRKKEPLDISVLKRNKSLSKIIIKEDDKLKILSESDFEKKFDVKYLPNLLFKDLKMLKDVQSKSQKALKDLDIAEKEIWLGTYYEKEIKFGRVANAYIKWIDEYKGYGLFALFDLKPETFIGEYTGEVRRHKKALDEKNSYCFEYKIGSSSKYTIDAKYMGNIIRFINHSFLPNLTTAAAYQGGIVHIILKTNSYIKKDSELSYDYGPTYWKKRENPL